MVQKQKQDASERPEHQARACSRQMLSHFENVNRKVQEKWKESDQASRRGIFKATASALLSLGLLQEHTCAAMTYQCERGCGAVHFYNESTRFLCCIGNGQNAGRGSFNLLNPTPDFLNDQLCNNHEFQRLIRAYNNTFQMSTCKVDSKFNSGMVISDGYPFYIRVYEKLCHGLPPVYAEGSDRKPQFAQIYMIDNALDIIAISNFTRFWTR